MAGTPTGTVARNRTLLPVAWALRWLPGSRLLNGEVLPDRAALIEAQIPGLHRFARALLRGATGRRLTTSFRTPSSARFLTGICGVTKRI